MSETDSAEFEQPKPSRVWMWVLPLIALCMLGYSFAKTQELPRNLAFGIGFWLVPSLIVMAVFSWISKASREHRGVVFGVLYACAIAGHLMGSQLRQEEALKAANSLKASMTNFVEQRNVGGEPGTIDLQPVTATAKGDLGVMEMVTKQLINDAATQQNEYMKALDAAGWPRLLDPERLKSDPTMKEGRAIVEASQAVVKKYRQLATEMLNSLPERARTAPFESESSRRDFLKGAESGSARGRANNERNWNYEEGILAEYSGVIELLASIPGQYEFQDDGTVLFQTDEAVEIYNGHMTKANEIIKAQEQAMKKQEAEAFKRLDAIGR